MKNPFLILSIIFWGTMILLIILDKLRAAQQAEARRQHEAEAQKAAKAAEVAQKQAEKEKREAERKAARQAKEEERRIAAAERHAETMRRREELHQQKMRQLAELQAAQAASTNQPKDEAPAEQAAQPEQAKPAPIPQKPVALSAEHHAPFAGKTVAFTGKIPGYTHEQAAQAVKLRGGRAFAKGMPAGTTLLVCGQQKGDGDSNKLKRADELIGQIRKISATQFLQIVNTFPV